MTDDLRIRIAAVHQAHRWGVFRCDDGYARTCCRCQWRELPVGPTHAEHVADAVIAELGRRKCQRCRIALPVDGFPMPHEGSDVMRPFCWSCTNYSEWATS